MYRRVAPDINGNSIAGAKASFAPAPFDLVELFPLDQPIEPCTIESHCRATLADHERATQQRGFLHHEIDQLVVAYLAIAQVQVAVGSRSLRERLMRREAGFIQNRFQLCAAEAVAKEITPLVFDVALSEELLSLATARSSGMDVDYHLFTLRENNETLSL